MVQTLSQQEDGPVGPFSPPLDDGQVEAVDLVKSWVGRQLLSRKQLPSGAGTADASAYWRFFTNAVEYVRELPTEQYRFLRHHTYHFDNDTYLGAFFRSKEYYRDRYRLLTAGLPQRYRIAAPRSCGEYGNMVDGALVNDKILYWQEMVRAFHHAGLLGALEKNARPFVLEVGGGYGSLANCLYQVLPDVLHVIVDLPESLLFSGAYLSMLHGKKRVLLHEGGLLGLAEIGSQHRFVLVPNFAITDLDNLRFDLAINVASFQEMTPSQVDEYLGFIARRCALLVSDNQDRQEYNKENLSVSALLLRRFSLTPLPRHDTGPESGIRMALQPLNTMLRRSVGVLLEMLRANPKKRFVARPFGKGRMQEDSTLNRGRMVP